MERDKWYYNDSLVYFSSLTHISFELTWLYAHRQTYTPVAWEMWQSCHQTCNISSDLKICRPHRARISVALLLWVRLHPAFSWLMECEGIMLIQSRTGARWHRHYAGECECMLMSVCVLGWVLSLHRQVNGDGGVAEVAPVLLSSVPKANMGESSR